MTRFIILSALGLAILVAITILFMPSPSRYMLGSTAQASRLLEEDDPSWDCRTMGNRLCGVKPSDPRFDQYDLAFNCFAELSYTQPRLTWTQKVTRCTPHG